ncbi:helix-turn-helix domain-containing protein [Pseudorhodobacter sp.]|uniref:helix-turn-helix domain-containing protein n=1 Tax=Pseudorhodobacter sp. TaxID=1934400 RepID=UPI002648685A|nr:helix-turn-helix domain-containing protein [Pseudorhodobacter sp.]MDN5789068.1 helix-turn-helix domain-containing protein [Pseudorhodobacter sp.]
MSHKATNWLASLDANLIGPSEFRVLFHLCDCHNPSAGCFPTQAYLIAITGASNGTVNNALNLLEEKRLIQRHRERDGKSRRQKPTRYILGFELVETQEPTPKSGDGKLTKPTPKSGDGADSKKQGEPSPENRVSRLQPTGEEPVKNQVTNQRAQSKPSFFTSDEHFEAREIAEQIKAGSKVVWSAVRKRVWECMIANNLISKVDAKIHGLICLEKGQGSGSR